MIKITSIYPERSFLWRLSTHFLHVVRPHATRIRARGGGRDKGPLL